MKRKKIKDYISFKRLRFLLKHMVLTDSNGFGAHCLSANELSMIMKQVKKEF